MKKIFSILVIMFISLASVRASCNPDTGFVETPIMLHTSTGDISGTITMPALNAVVPVALIISGSGPTDRNGNNASAKNDGLKQLAHALANENIASLRFDKRGIAASMPAARKEEDLRFENYIADVEEWISLLRKDKRFNKIIIIGHSEGSLIGMIAGKKADKFISVAGAGRSTDILLKEQLSTQPQPEKEKAYMIIDSLKNGYTVTDNHVSTTLNALFRKSVQPYLISWFKYDPQVEIKKLTIPVLILQGTNDLQVKEEDAKALSKADPSATLLLIENMNHVLKIANSQDENIKSYSDPTLPVSTSLVKAVITFIKSN